MKFAIVLLLSAASCMIACNPAKEVVSPEVLSKLETAEQEMFAATSAGDSAAFRRLAGKEYFTINAHGNSQNLEEVMPYIPRFKGSVAKLSQQNQRVYGNLALRTGLAKFYINDQLVAEALYTSGWVYRDNKWQFIHWQGTPTGILLEGKGMLEPPKD